MIEQNKSSGPKARLIEVIGGMIVRYQDATQRFDEAVGEVYDLGPTERLCLSLLWAGPQTASAIARQVRLTPAAVTSLIDRLEARGYVRRKADASDRRKVLVEAAEKTMELTREVYGPISEAGNANLAKYTEAELGLFQRILTDSLALQEGMTRDFLARHGKS
jgi:DNA-binding MarR family transcriptional regulator